MRHVKLPALIPVSATIGWVVPPALCILLCALIAPRFAPAFAQAADTVDRQEGPAVQDPDPEDAEAESGPEAPADPDPDSPRVSLQSYLDACRAGRYDEAARYLDLRGAGQEDGAQRARELKAVLDRHLWIDLDTISPLSAGDPNDGLPPGVDEVGHVPGAAGREERVRIVRAADSDPPRWVFSRATVGRIPSWYEQLDNRWAIENLPGPLLRPGPHELLWWQWIALPLLLAVAWAAARVLSGMSRALLARLTARTKSHWDDAIVARIVGPLTLAWMILAVYLLLPFLDLYDPAQAFANQSLRTGVFLAFFWSMLRTIDVLGQIITTSPWAADHPALLSLVPLGTRSAKVIVVAMAVIAVVSDFGYPVTSLIAGLSIGGLAVALAAQKTGENIFGAFSLGVDQPFKEGDFVRIEDFVGTVEAVGLRSTRFRTLDRTLISIPNGRLADMRLESFTARDRLRLACTVGLEYGTTAAQMRQVLEGLEGVLRAHPMIWPDAVVVRFKEFAASSLDIEIMAWFTTSVWSEFQLIRQDVLLQFMEVVEKAGASFAFPTRTVHLVTDPGRVA